MRQRQRNTEMTRDRVWLEDREGERKERQTDKEKAPTPRPAESGGKLEADERRRRRGGWTDRQPRGGRQDALGPGPTLRSNTTPCVLGAPHPSPCPQSPAPRLPPARVPFLQSPLPPPSSEHGRVFWRLCSRPEVRGDNGGVTGSIRAEVGRTGAGEQCGRHRGARALCVRTAPAAPAPVAVASRRLTPSRPWRGLELGSSAACPCLCPCPRGDLPRASPVLLKTRGGSHPLTPPGSWSSAPMGPQGQGDRPQGQGRLDNVSL